MGDLLVLVDVVTGGDQYVVHVDKEFGGVVHLHLSEHLIYGSLECGWGVG